MEYCNGKQKYNLIIKANPLIFKKEEPLNTYNYLNYRDEQLLNQKAIKKHLLILRCYQKTANIIFTRFTE